MVLYNLFVIYFKERYDTDECLANTFLNMFVATRRIYEEFAAVAL
jgi:hypothetical protein